MIIFLLLNYALAFVRTQKQFATKKNMFFLEHWKLRGAKVPNSILEQIKFTKLTILLITDAETSNIERFFLK